MELASEPKRLVLKKPQSCLSAVRALMDDYAKRGVFRGFTAKPVRNGVAAFRLLWVVLSKLLEG